MKRIFAAPALNLDHINADGTFKDYAKLNPFPDEAGCWYVPSHYGDETGTFDQEFDRAIEHYMMSKSPMVHFANAQWLKDFVKNPPCNAARRAEKKMNRVFECFCVTDLDGSHPLSGGVAGKQYLQVFRGVTKSGCNPIGQAAWTIDRKTAEFFAATYFVSADECKKVITAYIPREKAILFISDRSEKEVLVDTFTDDGAFLAYIEACIAGAETVTALAA